MTTTGPCPACHSSAIPGMQMRQSAIGRPAYQPCQVCHGEASIEMMTSEEARLAAIWLNPKHLRNRSGKLFRSLDGRDCEVAR